MAKGELVVVAKGTSAGHKVLDSLIIILDSLKCDEGPRLFAVLRQGDH